MCTVTVVPAKGGYIFTFSRDEAPARYTPHLLVRQHLPHKEIYFAKDSKAGGSWFAADNCGNIAMLFNGAFVKHEKKAQYAKSRGMVLLELFAATGMKKYFEAAELDDVEPFSVVLFEEGILYRLTWDGLKKHVTVLLQESSYIFSSATLYNENIQAARRGWLADFLKAQPSVDAGAMLAFHSDCKTEDTENGLVIKRAGSCSTLSISQAVVKPGLTELKHSDLVTGQILTQQIFKN